MRCICKQKFIFINSSLNFQRTTLLENKLFNMKIFHRETWKEPPKYVILDLAFRCVIICICSNDKHKTHPSHMKHKIVPLNIGMFSVPVCIVRIIFISCFV